MSLEGDYMSLKAVTDSDFKKSQRSCLFAWRLALGEGGGLGSASP